MALAAASPRLREGGAADAHRGDGGVVPHGGRGARRRQRLYTDTFTCLYDPRHARLRTLTEKEYFAREHVVVSYNGDLRGIVEDTFHKTRFDRCSVSSVAYVGAIIEGTSMLATLSKRIAGHIRAGRPHLKEKPLPFDIQGSYAELLWPVATDDDDACRFLRTKIAEIAS
jgi:LysR family transcriptional activator of mexEF-oprN operon